RWRPRRVQYASHDAPIAGMVQPEAGLSAVVARARLDSGRHQGGGDRSGTARSIAMMDPGRHIRSHFRAESGRFGLHPETLKADRVLNWGGFVGHSYTIGDGDRSIHVKLTTEPTELRRWLSIHDHLERDYRAPRVLAWADIPGTPLGGLVFEHIDGETWDTAARPALVQDLRDLLGRLHADRLLAGRIGDGPRSYRECWDLRYRDQFEQDLIAI